MQRKNESLDEWFMRAVLPHEAALLRYISRHWHDNAIEVGDLCQEALTRVYAAARQERPTYAKSFLFTTARRLIYDQIRRAKTVQIDTLMDLEELEQAASETAQDETISARQELKHLQGALGKLPPKCRKVIELRRVHGFTQKETAAKLGITEAAVEAQIQRGVSRLAETLRHVSEFAAKRFELVRSRTHKEDER